MKGARSLFLFLGASALVSSLSAAPADPTPFTVDNAGDSLTLREVGDEHYSYYQTLDGYLVIPDAEEVYRYATEEGVAGTVKAKNANLRSEEDAAYLNALRKTAVKNAHFKRHPDRLPIPAGEVFQKSKWVPSLDTVPDVPPLLRLPEASKYGVGTNRFPVLLVENSSVNSLDSAAYWAQVNQQGYSQNGHIGSARDYFIDQSNGIFVPSFDIFPVKIDGAMSDYKDKEGRLVKKAVDALLSKFPNFDASNYDADGDGEIDAVGVMYAGTKKAANSMGGFAYKLEFSATCNDNVGKLSAGNGKVFNRYFVLPQLNNDGKFSPIAQFVHEFSHTLGLKDHYCVYASSCYYDFTDSAYQAPGAHAWDVMASGMYNFDNTRSGTVQGATPVGYSAFEKAFLGWISYKTLESSWDVKVLEPFISTNVAYKIPVDGDEDEWFILENRQKTGWDAQLPNHGLLIWHIDYDAAVWKADALNDVSGHQRIDVVEAGNIKVPSFSKGNYYGSSVKWLDDDPYPGSQNVTSFSAVSWAGASLGVNLYNITEKNGNICFTSNSALSIGDCVPESSSSSSEWSGSSSSSAYESSSSSEATAIAMPETVRNSVEFYGRTLSVKSNLPGRKTLAVYDLSGRMLFRRDFDGAETVLDLRKASGNVLVVKLSAHGRVQSLKRIAVE